MPMTYFHLRMDWATNRYRLRLGGLGVDSN